MGLAERLTQAAAEASARENAAALEAQQKLLAEEAGRLKANFDVTQQISQQEAVEKARIDALMVKLTPLLEVVGARNQLEEARQFWKTGIIDPSPQLSPYMTIPQIQLALRHRYVTMTKSYSLPEYEWDGAYSDRMIQTSPGKHTSSYLQLCEDTVAVIAYQHEDTSSVHAYSGSQALTYRSFPGSDESGGWKFRYFVQTKPEQFQITNPDQAKKLLEDQLAHVLQGFKPYLDWQEKIGAEIAGDQFLSQPYALDYYHSLLKSTAGRSSRLPTSSATPWYKKLFS